MGFYESLCKKYSYENTEISSHNCHNWGSLQGYEEIDSSESSLDVALFASAIRVEMWKDLWSSIKNSNECSFKIFFCGNNKPKFDLPSNVVFIYSDMKPAACVEIAYRHAMASNSRYVMNITDDCDLTPGMLDSLIVEIVSHEEKNKGDIVVGPEYTPPTYRRHIDLHIVTDDHSSPQTFVFSMMKRKLAYRTGGLDKRFEALYWDLDRYLRLHALEPEQHSAPIEDQNIVFRICADLMIKEKKCGKGTLFQRFGTIDREQLDELWTWWPCKRSEPVQYYDDKDLTFTLDWNK
tara:strand:- start:130 stop:1008 length:879 start_codon:yes stop_codon:yes gene_type:complete